MNNLFNNPNKHLMHLEDVVYLANIIDFLSDVKLMLSIKNDRLIDNTSKMIGSNSLNLSIKYDGSPSILVWKSFPGLNNYGIATKSLFSSFKNAMYTEEDINSYCKGDLKKEKKLITILNAIKDTDITENVILQGDLMFTKDSITQRDNLIEFTPNIVTYKENDQINIDGILASDIGVAWHTYYVMRDDKIYAIDGSIFVRDGKIYNINPYIHLDTFINDFDIDNTLIKNINQVLFICENMDIINYENLINIDIFKKTMYSYINNLVRNGKYVDCYDMTHNTIEFCIREFKLYLYNKVKENTFKLKTNIAKERHFKQYDEMVKMFDTNHLLYDIFKLIGTLTIIKHILLPQLEKFIEIPSYIKIGEKIYSDYNEGFVAKLNNFVIKLVDRRKFSSLNFYVND